MGLHRAGFTVTGIDIEPQPEYPFEFIQADALRPPVNLEDFDLIWASPPCQAYIRSGLVNKSKAPDLVGPVREMLERSGVPWIIENVPGAPLRADAVLCGSAFGLPVRRHRVFEMSWAPCLLTPACDHSRPVVGVYGNPHGESGAWPGMLPGTLETWREAMGIDWMGAASLSQAIPPAYSEFLARAMLSARDAA